jgi:hypothetical protein
MADAQAEANADRGGKERQRSASVRTISDGEASPRFLTPPQSPSPQAPAELGGAATRGGSAPAPPSPESPTTRQLGRELAGLKHVDVQRVGRALKEARRPQALQPPGAGSSPSASPSRPRAASSAAVLQAKPRRYLTLNAIETSRARQFAVVLEELARVDQKLQEREDNVRLAAELGQLLLEKNSRLEETVTELSEKLRAYEEEREDLEAETKRAQRRLSELSAVQRQNSDLLRQLSVSQGASGAAADAEESAEASMTDFFKSELVAEKKWTGDMATDVRELRLKLRRERRQHRAELLAAEERDSLQREQMTALEESNKRLSSRLAEAARAEDENATLRRRIDELNDRLEQQRVEHLAEQQALQESLRETHAAQVAAFEAELSRLRSNVGELRGAAASAARRKTAVSDAAREQSGRAARTAGLHAELHASPSKESETKRLDEVTHDTHEASAAASQHLLELLVFLRQNYRQSPHATQPVPALPAALTPADDAAAESQCHSRASSDARSGVAGRPLLETQSSLEVQLSQSEGASSPTSSDGVHQRSLHQRPPHRRMLSAASQRAAAAVHAVHSTFERLYIPRHFADACVMRGLSLVDLEALSSEAVAEFVPDLAARLRLEHFFVERSAALVHPGVGAGSDMSSSEEAATAAAAEAAAAVAATAAAAWGAPLEAVAEHSEEIVERPPPAGPSGGSEKEGGSAASAASAATEATATVSDSEAKEKPEENAPLAGGEASEREDSKLVSRRVAVRSSRSGSAPSKHSIDFDEMSRVLGLPSPVIVQTPRLKSTSDLAPDLVARLDKVAQLCRKQWQLAINLVLASFMDDAGHRQGRSRSTLRAQGWVPDEASICCRVCDADFGLFTRRHHCRLCGELFCARCCWKKISLEEFSLANLRDADVASVRVCDSCSLVVDNVRVRK